ncbi:Uncharacterized membrane protein YsdA, DUF1294 family [Caloramator quimbayensis]|uniref:Uncharacterized membrane protein YsdA, DUF1294 family n=1 Tax=Caloramator quimbayensis TaxID=1147123 RepID=A0A1T4X7T6_9CLOT|nr:DUF1294 domain-containing protein [Caloramator quimbayensis]SKA85135.1 Uncharacterized membrane protein YsdA, DUF1294 family [Caloramator quimbayensis]
MKIIICYLFLINLYAFFIMYFDKTKSKKRQFRISEKKLFLTAILFGSIGIYAGMYFFRHKTKHKKFTIGIPSIILIQLFVFLKIIGKI